MWSKKLREILNDNEELRSKLLQDGVLKTPDKIPWKAFEQGVKSTYITYESIFYYTDDKQDMYYMAGVTEDAVLVRLYKYIDKKV